MIDETRARELVVLYDKLLSIDNQIAGLNRYHDMKTLELRWMVVTEHVGSFVLSRSAVMSDLLNQREMVQETIVGKGGVA